MLIVVCVCVCVCVCVYVCVCVCVVRTMMMRYFIGIFSFFDCYNCRDLYIPFLKRLPKIMTKTNNTHILIVLATMYYTKCSVCGGNQGVIEYVLCHTTQNQTARWQVSRLALEHLDRQPRFTLSARAQHGSRRLTASKTRIAKWKQ